MATKYYRLYERKNPEENGTFLKQTKKGLEVLTGEETFESLKIRVRGERLFPPKGYVLDEVDRETAQKAKADYNYFFGMTTCVGCGPTPSTTVKVYPGGLY
jgi:hypothetical protein